MLAKLLPSGNLQIELEPDSPDYEAIRLAIEPPPNCTCGYPLRKWRSGSGHHGECPVHQEWLDDGGFQTFAEPEGQAKKQVAGRGHDAMKAEQLLASSKRQGIATLDALCRKALKRLINPDRPETLLRATSLFTHEELTALAKQFLATNVTADLLGRSRIRLRHDAKTPHTEPTHFIGFAESGGMKPMSPRSAIDYFRRLVPRLSTWGDRAGGADVYFGPMAERKAFELAGVTDVSVLDKIKEIILGRLQTGEKVSSAPKEIEDVLIDAGVSISNPTRAESIFRTETMNALNAGAWREFSDPELEDSFGVWRWLGVKDGRQRRGPLPAHADHERFFGKYWPRTVSFNEVRGYKAQDVINCVLPGNLVAGNMRAASKAFYSGDAFEIKMASGVLLTITGNHPVFAEDRLTFARHLHKGLKTWSYLVNHQGSLDSDVYDGPSVIDKVFNSMPTSLASKRRLRFDFYGDGEFFKSDIDVVSADVLRVDKWDFQNGQQIGDVKFEFSLDGGVGRPDLSQSLFLRHLRPLKPLGIRAAARLDSDAFKFPSDATSANAKMLCAGVFRNPFINVHLAKNIERDGSLFSLAESQLVSPFVNCLDVDIKLRRDIGNGHALQEKSGDAIRRRNSLELSSLDDVANRNVVFPDDAFENGALYAEFIHALSKGFPGQIILDEVASIKRFHYSGPVYDVETDTGYFIGGHRKGTAAVCRNCRCIFQPVYKKDWLRLQAQGKKLESWP